MGLAYDNTYQYDKAIKYYNQAADIAGKINHKPTLASCYANIAVCYFRQNLYNQALLFHQKAIKIYTEVKDKKSLAHSLMGIGSIYGSQGSYEQASSHMLQALRIAEKENDLHNTALISLNLGVQFRKHRNLSEAEKYFLYALKISKIIGNQFFTAGSLSELGSIYSDKGNYQKALEYKSKAHKNFDQLGNLLPKAVCLSDIGEIYLQLNKFDQAKVSILNAIVAYEKIDEQRGITNAKGSLAKLYKETKQYSIALSYAKQTLALANQLNIKEELGETYELLSELYELTGNARKSLQNYKLYIQYKDSLLNAENTSKINELQIRYETEKKEQQIKALSQQARIQQLELKQQRLYVLGLIALVVLVLLLVFLFIRQHALRSQQKTLELEQKLLRTQLNPHFIFNALTAIQTFVFSNAPAEAGKYLAKFAKLMRAILENSREEYIPLAKEIETLENYFALQQLRFEDKFEYQIYVDPRINIDEVVVPPMFAQPFIENSLEHGILHKSEQGLIQVRFSQEGDQVRMEVEDNGVGRQRRN